MKSLDKRKRISLGLLVTLFTLVSLGGSLLFPRSAQAAMPVSIVEDLTQQVIEVSHTIKENLGIAVLSAAQQAVSYFFRKIAYDSAVWLASGGKGQSPFAHTSSFGDYMANVGSDAFGTFIEELGKPFGLDLCKIPDIKIDLAFRIGLRMRFDEGGPQKPNCNFQTFTKNWSADAWKSKYGSKESLQKQFNASLSVDDSDLGIYLTATEKVDRLVLRQKDAAAADRQEGQGFIPLTKLISGDILTPGQVQKQEMEANAPSQQNARSQQQVGYAMGSGFFQIVPSSMSLFLNTLANQMVKNFMTQGMLPFGVCVGDYGGPHCKTPGAGSSDLAQFEGSGILGGRAAAVAAFSELLVSPINVLDSYNLMGQLSSCPDSPATYNCRADEYLIQAVQEANYGKPLTIREALDKKWLHPDWKLISDEVAAKNMDRNCFNQAYCHANIKVLRQVRILPLGFEIAAKNSDPDHLWTLKEVVDGFNDCNYQKDSAGNILGVKYDPVNKPFCHLIDPNWVLKSPPTRCNAFVYGSMPLMAGTPERLQDCVDLSTCVAYNKDGTCLSYGYCAREKNVWRFDADKCDAQYRTCRAFIDAGGQAVAYLMRTLDTGYCNASNVGCLAYSLNQNKNGVWDAPGAIGYGSYNAGAYFNSQLSSACGANSAGCSAFKFDPENSNKLLYLRKAPDYLNCYDTDANQTNGVEWPKTAADLVKMKPKAECADYSQACIADEVNCNWYTPLLNVAGEKIPGRFTLATVDNGQIVWNDQCDKSCVGYAAYKELSNNYSNGQDIAYVIPSSGSTCSATEEGCSSFTNMGETFNGGEKVEYYSDLRLCILPDQVKQKNFYTYESSAVGGYQLKSYTLEKDASGGPKYFYRTTSELQEYDKICNADLYKKNLADADCRQFNDEAGAIYYRLLDKTIVVSDQCTSYRLNSSEMYVESKLTDAVSCAGQKGLWNNGQCQLCFSGGEYKDGFCFYQGLPAGVATNAGQSQSCSANVVSCHAYKGNAGNNIKQIFQDNFEDASTTVALAGWQSSGGALAVAPESTHMGEHSLGFTGTGELSRQPTSDEFAFTIGDSYNLSFWAKGTGQNLSVSLRSGTKETIIEQVGIGDIWKYYKFSPVELQGTSTSTQLVFKTASNGKLFLDNVIMTEVSDYIYLVRDTLKVDPICDSIPSNNLPGEALGCSAYQYPSQDGDNTVYLTGFSYLCRENAVGCTALWDTHNTINDEKSRAYNVWIGNLLSPSVSGQEAKVKIGKDEYSCQIPKGQLGCYINVFGYSKSEIEAAQSANGLNVTAMFIASTVFVPADTTTSTPLYLVADKDATCNQVDLGCTVAGQQQFGPTGLKFVTTTIKNDPMAYEGADSILCTGEAAGCGSYSSGEGTYYFKDPVVSGQKLCAYKTSVKIDGVSSNGWFWKGVGKCSTSGVYCSQESDCGAQEKCADVGNQPCYPNFVQSGPTYGLWSYGDGANYQNFVGECPSEQSGCTEYVDRNDKDRAYYLINNNKINQGDCDGQVSLKYGCALFDQTDKPEKLWSTSLTYLASKYKDSEKVAPVVAPVGAAATSKAQDDANILIKVIRDRECGEWLQCQSSHRVWDAKLGRWKQVCDDIGRCNKAPETAQESNITDCANFVDGQHELANQILTPEVYQLRDTDWKGQDMSGYSLLNLYPVEELSQVDVSPSSTQEADWRLVKTIPCGGKNCPDNPKPGDTACKVDGQACGKNNSGECMSQRCLQTIAGESQDIADKSPAQTCRAYPEPDSPFPHSLTVDKVQSFANVNVCNEVKSPTSDSDTNNQACECNYTKVDYGTGTLTKYWDYSNPNSYEVMASSSDGVIPGGVCFGGSQSGVKACNVDGDCDGGVCQRKTKESKLVGWQGMCLEGDNSRSLNGNSTKSPCLTWLPVDTLSGALDINNQHVEAGFEAMTDSGMYYCAGAEGNQNVSFAIDLKDTFFGDIKLFPNEVGYEHKLLEEYIKHSYNGQFGTINSISGICKQWGATLIQQPVGGCYDISGCLAVEPYKSNPYGVECVGGNLGGKGDREKRIRKIDGYLLYGLKKGTVIYRDAIDYIKVTVSPGSQSSKDWFFDTPGAFIIRNGYKIMYIEGERLLFNAKGQLMEKDKSELIKNELKESVKAEGSTDERLITSDGTGKTIWYLRADDGQGEGGDDPDNNYQFALPSSFSQGLDLSQYPVLSKIQEKNEGNLFFDSLDCDIDTPGLDMWQDCVANDDSKDDACGVRIKFDSAGKLDEVLLVCHTGDWTDTESVNIAVTVGLREPCTYVAQTSQDAYSTVGWTNRLWPGNKFAGSFTSSSIWSYPNELPRSPFGSLGLSEWNNEKLISIWRQYKEPATEAAVQGAPFGCSEDCLETNTGAAKSFEPDITKTGAASNNGAGFAELNNLFAKIYQGWNWDFAKSEYKGAAYPGDNETGTASPFTAPQVRAAQECNDQNSEICAEGVNGNITINGDWKKDVKLSASPAKAIARFYAFANPNHMPIKQVRMDWDDGTGILPIDGFIRDQRGAVSQGTCDKIAHLCGYKPYGVGSDKVLALPDRPCNADEDCTFLDRCVTEDIAPFFNRIVGKTCDNAYFQFEHVYTCAKDSPYFQTDCPDKQMKDMFGGCCVFKPKVQVKDNWGWCNGSCPGGPENSEGCYDQNDKGGAGNECTFSPGSWTAFQKQVLVAPK